MWGVVNERENEIAVASLPFTSPFAATTEVSLLHYANKEPPTLMWGVVNERENEIAVASLPFSSSFAATTEVSLLRYANRGPPTLP